MRHHTLHEALLYGRGTERPFLCPSHGDSRPSASVNIVKQRWYCYTCGARGGLTGEDALIEPDYEVMKLWFAEKMEEGRVYPEAWLARWDAGRVHRYWTQRVGDVAARAHRLGYDAERNAVTYPLRSPSGDVLGVVRRPLDATDGPKYLYPKGVDVARLLYNYGVGRRSAVVLVEGALDAIALWRVGIHAFAIYGSRLSSTQVQLVDRVDPDYIYTAYDNDDAGYRAHCDTERAFKHRLVTRLTWPRSWGKDVDEIGQDRLRKVVSPLASSGLACVVSETCRSPESTTRQPAQSAQSSLTTSTHGRLTIVRQPA